MSRFIRYSHDNLPYLIARQMYEQGLECDDAARLIRQRLPALLLDVRTEVQESAPDYNEKKEAPWLQHIDHGREASDCDGPADSDCPCRATDKEWECAYHGCGFCRAAQDAKEKELGGA